MCFLCFLCFFISDQKINRVCVMWETDEPNRHQAIEHNLTLRVKTRCSVKTRSAQTVSFKCAWNTHRSLHRKPCGLRTGRSAGIKCLRVLFASLSCLLIYLQFCFSQQLNCDAVQESRATPVAQSDRTLGLDSAGTEGEEGLRRPLNWVAESAIFFFFPLFWLTTQHF